MSPLANALAIPIVTFAVVPLALTAIVLPIDALWTAAHAVFAALMIPLEALAALPDAAWQQHAPADWAVVVALAGVLLLAAPRGVPGRVLGAIALLPLFVVRPAPPRAGHVPHDGARRRTGARGGRRDARPRASLRYRSALHRRRRCGRTHRRAVPSRDRHRALVRVDRHAPGQPTTAAARSASCRSCRSIGSPRRCPAEHAILARRSADGGAALRCEAGQRWIWDGVRFEVLQPTVDHYAMPRLKPNDLSCVVRIESDHGSALLTGDLEARGELELVRRDGVTLEVGRARRARITAAELRRRRPSSPRLRRRSPSSRRAIAIASAIRAPTSSPATTTRAFGPIAPTTTAR